MLNEELQGLIVLEGSLDLFRDAFNGARGILRFVAILSPT